VNIIPFPKREVLNVTTMPLNHIRTYCKSNKWLGFTIHQSEDGKKLEIRRTYGGNK